MERTLFLAATFWTGSVGALAVSAGYLGAQHLSGRRAALPEPRAGEVVCAESGSDDDAPVQLMAPPEPGAMLTESERRRLRPVNPLRRTRRSRKIRAPTEESGKFVPLVPGARTSDDEAIVAAFASEALGDQQEAGDDYWVDPALASQEIEAERREQMRVEKFAKKKNAFKQAKLKEEIVAPYKANVIVYLVVGIGVIGTLFALFPQLLETPTLNMGATFPGDL